MLNTFIQQGFNIQRSNKSKNNALDTHAVIYLTKKQFDRGSEEVNRFCIHCSM